MFRNQSIKQPLRQTHRAGRSIVLRAGGLGAEMMLQTQNEIWFLVQIHVCADTWGGDSHPLTSFPLCTSRQPSRGLAEGWIREQWAERTSCDRHTFVSRNR